MNAEKIYREHSRAGFVERERLNSSGVALIFIRQNMGRAGAGRRPFDYGLPADTRSLEGGLPFVLKGRQWVKHINAEYKKNFFRKSTQRSMLPSVVATGFDASCYASKKPTAEISSKRSTSSSNSKGTLPDTLQSLLGTNNRDATLSWISLLILPEPALIPSPNSTGTSSHDTNHTTAIQTHSAPKINVVAKLRCHDAK